MTITDERNEEQMNGRQLSPVSTGTKRHSLNESLEGRPVSKDASFEFGVKHHDIDEFEYRDLTMEKDEESREGSNKEFLRRLSDF